MKNRSFCATLCVAISVSICSFGGLKISAWAQPSLENNTPSLPVPSSSPLAPTVTQPTTSQSTVREREVSSSKEVIQSPLKEREVSVSKTEIKEIKEHPDFLVGLANALAWPLIFFLAILGLLFSGTLRRALGLFPKIFHKLKISAAGVEMEISREAVEEVRSYLRIPFAELRARADVEYKNMAEVMRVYDLLQDAVDGGCMRALQAQALARPAVIRGTVHVADIVFNEYLYQLVDYYPGSRVNAPAGRRFSQRFGIIGRSWRLGESMARPSAPGNSDDDIRDLIQEWGMTREEAAGQSRSHPACLCVVLKSPEDNNLPVGLLYLDANRDMAFGDDRVARQVALAMETDEAVLRLAVAVGRAIMSLRAAGPRLNITQGF